MESHSDFKELLQSFARYEVRYLVVGGHAVMHYSEPRWTKDLDLWIDNQAANASKVFTALAEFGVPLGSASAEDFERPGMVFQIGIPPLRADILTSLSGITFNEAWPNRQPGEIFGCQVEFASREDLIKNKRAAGRHIDLHDAETLERGGIADAGE